MNTRSEHPHGRTETREERLDRNLEELLAGLRVALPGVQVLFAFLLIVPFQGSFDSVSPFEEKVYFGTLLATAVATALLIAPSARHRILFRRGDKEWIVKTANRLAIAGLATLSLAMSGAVLLVSAFLFERAVPIIATTAILATTMGLWFASPLARLARRR